jgi:hypothetical protein
LDFFKWKIDFSYNGFFLEKEQLKPHLLVNDIDPSELKVGLQVEKA